MAKKQSKAAIKTRKKRWFQISAPKLFDETMLGEIPAYEPEELIGKSLAVNMMFLTNDPKKQSFRMSFRIVGVDESKTITEISEYVMLPSQVRRLVRRGKTRMDESVVLETKDGVRARFKPLALTRGVTTSSVVKSLRKKLLASFSKMVQSAPFEDVVRDIITGKLQSSIRAEMSKIHPMVIIEIRAIKRMESKKQPVAPEPTPAPAAVA